MGIDFAHDTNTPTTEQASYAFTKASRILLIVHTAGFILCTVSTCLSWKYRTQAPASAILSLTGFAVIVLSSHNTNHSLNHTMASACLSAIYGAGEPPLAHSSRLPINYITGRWLSRGESQQYEYLLCPNNTSVRQSPKSSPASGTWHVIEDKLFVITRISSDDAIVEEFTYDEGEGWLTRRKQSSSTTAEDPLTLQRRD